MQMSVNASASRLESCYKRYFGEIDWNEYLDADRNHTCGGNFSQSFRKNKYICMYVDMLVGQKTCLWVRIQTNISKR